MQKESNTVYEMTNETEKLAKLTRLLREFNPQESKIDRLLLYQITGTELDDCMNPWKKVTDRHDRSTVVKVEDIEDNEKSIE